ncbi:hypothetical protein [Methylobacterium sp. WCS2018Hpa-22]|uniref:hypothetical protein n=1 Tax=Methylobacterium sp. WCS2018Hpa-22 TaxID=3073633 RepID=UPI00288AA027|nr:hypothetical protein [Methylobacterium sp. WCS2018Hpa-22]
MRTTIRMRTIIVMTMQITGTRTLMGMTATLMCMGRIASTIINWNSRGRRQSGKAGASLFDADMMKPDDIRFSVAPMMDGAN